jgi:peptide-methionine (S)-S-oxide reductase
MTRTLKLGLIIAASVASVALPAMVTMRDKAEGTAVPPAALNDPVQGNRQEAVLAGGCFWGVEAVYEHVRGVIDVRSGFAGGGGTSQAEAVRIVFDPQQVSYAELLRILFAVVADPTQVNRQGPDVGPQYRTAIFPQSPAQAKVAQAYLAQLKQARVFNKPIATKIENGRFVEVGANHQDFARKNPAHPYIVMHDKPKLAALRSQFPAMWKG